MSHFQNICILGGGLLGGSIAKALESKSNVKLCFRNQESALAALDSGFAGATHDLSEAVEKADLLILAVPVGAMPKLLSDTLEAGLPSHCLITDVGSVKHGPHRDLTPLLEKTGHEFIGSHPMAGSERNGIKAARSDLFQKAACLLTNDSKASPSNCDALEKFWQFLGCRTSWLTATAHDRLVARISHLPHVTAAATAIAALSEDPQSGAFAGGGLRDTTRVAGGNPIMWTEILLENREEVSLCLQETRAKLDEFLVALQTANSQELLRLLEEAKTLRDTLI